MIKILPERSEHQELCRLLDGLTPGLLPPDVFHALARIMVTTTFVVVPLLRRQAQTLVLLCERDADDPCYPSLLNVPGTVIRTSDTDLPMTYQRLVATERPEVPLRSGLVFVGNVYDRIARGREVSLIHWVRLEDTVSSDLLFDAAMLPDRVVPPDRARVEMAVAHFNACQKGGHARGMNGP